MPTAKERAIRIFEEEGGLLRSAEARRLGIHPQTLKRMTEDGLLEKMERGLYHLRHHSLHGHSDMVVVARRVPDAVFCLTTALQFYGLTTQLPRKVYIALPQDTKAPTFEYPKLDVVWLSDKPYGSGIESVNLHGQIIKVYSKAKTVADCFKFRNKIGEDVAIEALKEYLQDRDRSIPQLMEYAEVDRVAPIVEPYLKAMV